MQLYGEWEHPAEGHPEPVLLLFVGSSGVEAGEVVVAVRPATPEMEMEMEMERWRDR